MGRMRSGRRLHLGDRAGRWSLRKNTLKVVATESLTSDPQGANRWLASLPASAEKDGMVGDAIGLILEGEQLGSSGWTASVDRMPGGGHREIARLIAEIRSASEKQSVSEKLGCVWLRKDPDAARGWLENSTLPPDVKSACCSPRKSDPRRRDRHPPQQRATISLSVAANSRCSPLRFSKP